MSYHYQVAQRNIYRRCGNPHRLRSQRGGGRRKTEVVTNPSMTGSAASFFVPPTGPSRRHPLRDEGQQEGGALESRPTSVLASATQVVLLALVLAEAVLVVASPGQSGFR
jgi:hypothetical protein